MFFVWSRGFTPPYVWLQVLVFSNTKYLLSHIGYTIDSSTMKITLKNKGFKFEILLNYSPVFLVTWCFALKIFEL